MGNPIKGSNYIRLLDDARCEGNWHNIPELVRKIRKHAPERACLALTAEAEHAGHKAISALPHPPTADAPLADRDLASRLPKLLTAIEAEAESFEDRFQAQVCVGWMHWLLGEHGLAVARLPRPLDLACPNLDPAERVAEWSNACALKAAYLKANCLARINQPVEALAAFEGALPSLAGIWAGAGARTQLRYWAELFLRDYCLLAGEALGNGTKRLTEENALAAFRSWARYWEKVTAGVNPLAQGFRTSRAVWHQYYLALSRILEQDLPLPTGHVAGLPASDQSSRSHLRAELKTVEASLEALLLAETRFPRADEETLEVEAFAKLVVRNWSILCGRGWRGADLGPGGRPAMSRGVIDTLYKAGTKTFQSTAILRFLFLVHLSIAEFDLAFKAFDTWIEVVRNAKARVDKTGRHEPSLDDDGTVLETTSRCITALCRFRDFRAAERARDLGAELEDWLARLPQLRGSPDATASPASASASGGGGDGDGGGGNTSLIHPKIAPETIALSWQAIGLSQAHWAGMTYEAASRTEIQTKAIRCLRKSLSPDYGRPKDARSLFALGLLLAERREIAAAIELVKSALVSGSLTGGGDGGGDDDGRNVLLMGPYWRERSLVSLWHLLALLLSARQEYVMAARACEGALEQFKDPTVLTGFDSFKSEHLREAAAALPGDRARGLFDEMDDTEREGILEVKMTQLALVELLQGPDVAVNASSELLQLYSRLFVPPRPPQAEAAPKTADAVPRSSAATLRSIKGSIFGGTRREKERERGRGREERAEREPEREGRPRQSTNPANGTAAAAAAPAEPDSNRPHTMQTTAGTAPTIHITREPQLLRTNSSDKPGRSASVGRRRSESTKRNNLRKREKEPAGSRRRAVSSGAAPRRPTVVDGESFFTPGPEDDAATTFLFPGAPPRTPSRRSSLSKSGRSLIHFDSLVPGKSADAADVYTGTARGASRSAPAAAAAGAGAAPVLPAVITLTKDLEKRHRTGILVKVWLMIAGFYRRAAMFEDGRAAVAEAQRLVQGLEADMAREVIVFKKSDKDWGYGKGVEELWGDVWAELGNLALAKEDPHAAQTDFEAALTHWPDHPLAIIGLSTILLDIYNQALLPPPAVPKLPSLSSPGLEPVSPPRFQKAPTVDAPAIPSKPLGLETSKPENATDAEKPGELRRRVTARSGSSFRRDTATPTTTTTRTSSFRIPTATSASPPSLSRHPTNASFPTADNPPVPGPEDIYLLTAAYKAASLPLIDRLAARDRAYGLLSGLTRLGTGWNLPEAWLALARAHEESGRPDRAKEVLWWCVELEEGRGVRGWGDLGYGGYVL